MHRLNFAQPLSLFACFPLLPNNNFSDVTSTAGVTSITNRQQLSRLGYC